MVWYYRGIVGTLSVSLRFCCYDLYFRRRICLMNKEKYRGNSSVMELSIFIFILLYRRDIDCFTFLAKRLAGIIGDGGQS